MTGQEMRENRDSEVKAAVEKLAEKICAHAKTMGHELNLSHTQDWVMRHVMRGSVDYDERLSILVRMILRDSI